MKHLIILLIIACLAYAASSEKKSLSFDTNSTMSAKEITFQNYLKKRNKENKKLEDDGFCSCNNN